MPELPDVEVFKRYVDSTSLHQNIDAIEVKDRRILGNAPASELKRGLEGGKFESARRHGKYLFVELGSGGWLLLHFGMTGSLKYYKNADDEPPHARFLISFSNGYHLAFDDQRLFGKVDLIGDPESFVESQNLGPDPLALDFPGFRERLEGKRGAIKAELMNQALLAGIGNIYSDEILFQARIHPVTRAGQLDEEALKRLFDETQRTLHEAIEHGADPDDLSGSFLLPRRREGEECPRGNGNIEKIKAAGRTAYYCPACQPKR